MTRGILEPQSLVHYTRPILLCHSDNRKNDNAPSTVYYFSKRILILLFIKSFNI